MVGALIAKELRETRALTALAVAFYFILVSGVTKIQSRVFTPLFGWIPGMSVDPDTIPFVSDEFGTTYCFIGAALAIALGFRQSAWEPSQGTALYLLHLPVGRRRIFLIKLMTGIGLLFVCTLIPIVSYAAWAATPGTHASPFEWSMTGSAFRIWLILPLVYLGAFASGIRPARWFGSRLLPLLAVAFPAVFCFAIAPWWLIGLPLLLLVMAALVSDILWEAATRDF